MRNNMSKLTNEELQIAINQMSAYLTCVKSVCGYDAQIKIWKEHLSKLCEIQVERAKLNEK